MTDLPGFSFWFSAWPTVWLIAFLAFMGGALLGLAPFALRDWLKKRREAREQRELDEATDHLMRIGFLANERALRMSAVRADTTKRGREVEVGFRLTYPHGDDTQ